MCFIYFYSGGLYPFITSHWNHFVQPVHTQNITENMYSPQWSVLVVCPSGLSLIVRARELTQLKVPITSNHVGHHDHVYGMRLGFCWLRWIPGFSFDWLRSFIHFHPYPFSAAGSAPSVSLTDFSSASALGSCQPCHWNRCNRVT